jgi:hypothetical protein
MDKGISRQAHRHALDRPDRCESLTLDVRDKAARIGGPPNRPKGNLPSGDRRDDLIHPKALLRIREIGSFGD